MDLSINPIHSAIFLISFLGILISLLEIGLHPERFGYMIAPLSYILNVFLYNLVLHLVMITHLNILNLQQLEVWSGVIRLHSLLLFIALIIIQPLRKH